jgi:hypothetical protein
VTTKMRATDGRRVGLLLREDAERGLHTRVKKT